MKIQGSKKSEINKLYNIIDFIATEVFEGLQRKLLLKQWGNFDLGFIIFSFITNCKVN